MRDYDSTTDGERKAQATGVPGEAVAEACDGDDGAVMLSVSRWGNVVDLSERRALLRDAPEPCAATIAEIEHLLSRAKRGEVIGVAYACATPAGGMGTGFEFGKARSGFALLAGAHVLARRLEDEHR